MYRSIIHTVTRAFYDRSYVQCSVGTALRKTVSDYFTANIMCAVPDIYSAA